MGRLLDKLKHTCPQCRVEDFAERINGSYPRSGARVSLWECPSCKHIWRDRRAKPEEEGSKDYAALKSERWKEALQMDKSKSNVLEISL